MRPSSHGPQELKEVIDEPSELRAPMWIGFLAQEGSAVVWKFEPQRPRGVPPLRSLPLAQVMATALPTAALSPRTMPSSSDADTP